MEVGTTATAGKRPLRFALVFVLLLGLVATFGVGTAQAQNGKVLILGSTVTGGASSNEASAATAAGLGFDIVTDAQWAAMTTAQFRDYNALVLGDPTCFGPGLGSGATTAAANSSVWGPAVDGNVLLVGTDEVFHDSQGGLAVTNNGVAFAGDDVDKTGMYISLSCYYHNTAPSTVVPLLAPFGAFTVTGVGCYNDAHIVATHPALTGITDTSLSGWSCSVHEAFDSFPSAFLPLAIAEDPAGGPPLPGSRSFPDGTSGVPYILARGSGVRLIGQIDLTPDTATNPVGTSHTVTATVKENGVAQAGKTVTFRVIAGPHAGLTGTGVTNASGQATFTYTGASAGTDQITAEYTDSAGALKTSNTALKTWEGGADTGNPTCVLTATIVGPPKKIQITVQDSGSGIASIVVTKSQNATTVVPAFSPGTTSAVLVEATKITQSLGSVVELTVTDVAGNRIVCDPVWPGTKAKAKAKKLTKKAVSKKMRSLRQHIRTHR